ncbi:MAG: hypothetical protein ACK5KL_19725 [Dysgonomonas sp.]
MVDHFAKFLTYLQTQYYEDITGNEVIEFVKARIDKGSYIQNKTGYLNEIASLFISKAFTSYSL